MEGPLATDLYQLTMAYSYWKSGRSEEEAVFHMHFRTNPFHGGYAIACGLEPAIDWLRGLHFTPDDLTYLATLTGADSKPLFEPEFLEYLGRLELTLDVDAVPEGTVVFANEPLVRVRGSILQAQIVETALLCIVNFQTLVATKAARLCEAAGGQSVVEFGLRRAQGLDGALAASRAAYIGGCCATSNVYAGKRYGIPVRGTHAHSWVMAFDSEVEAFEAYARAMPGNCTFLVDTYSTVGGVQHAVEAARSTGARINGVRLDSGDLAWLSGQARKILDENGFPDAVIFATNDLDEYTISSIKRQPGNAVSEWGVGTKLVTSFDQPALGGVYKLAAIRRSPDAPWEHRLKLSEQAIKVSNPGIQNTRRFLARGTGEAIGDAIYDELLPMPQEWVIVDPADHTRRKKMPATADSHDLLVPLMRGGKVVYPFPGLEDIRSRVQAQLRAFHPGIRRFENPHEYPVGLERHMYDNKTELILKLRELHQPKTANGDA
eukprot:m51a1_g3725 putative nicotinate phosphoribosyltransferase (491) ;mRNA; f:15742-17363